MNGIVAEVIDALMFVGAVCIVIICCQIPIN